MHLKIKNDGWLLLKIINPRKIAFSFWNKTDFRRELQGQVVYEVTTSTEYSVFSDGEYMLDICVVFIIYPPHFLFSPKHRN